MINITCAYTFDEQHIAIVYNCHKQYKWQVKWAHTMTLIVSLSQSEMPRWKSNQLSAKYVFINWATGKNCEDWGILPTSTTRSKCHSFQTEKKTTTEDGGKTSSFKVITSFIIYEPSMSELCTNQAQNISNCSSYWHCCFFVKSSMWIRYKRYFTRTN